MGDERDERGERPPENRDTTPYVRKSWVLVVAYYAATSLALGFVIGAGRYSRSPRCECGGPIEPAFLWKPGVSELDSMVG